MMTRRNVTVTVQLGGGVKTDDDVKMMLTDDNLPDDWSVKKFSEPTMRIELMVPKDVSEEDVQTEVHGLMVGIDSAQNFSDDSGKRGKKL